MTTPTLNRRLNLVLPIERSDKSVVYVHHQPIPEESFNAQWLLFTKVISRLYQERLLPSVANRVGMKMLLMVADEMNVRKQVEEAVLPDFWRLTTVMSMTDKGWAPTPFDLVIQPDSTILDTSDIEEVKNFVTFFTLGSWVHPAKELTNLLYPELQNCGGQFGSWTPMEYITFLKTSTKDGTTGAKTPPPDLQLPH